MIKWWTEFFSFALTLKEIRALKAKEALGTSLCSDPHNTDAVKPTARKFYFHLPLLRHCGLKMTRTGRKYGLSHLSVWPRSSVWSNSKNNCPHVSCIVGMKNSLGVSCVYMSWSHSEWQTGAVEHGATENKESPHWTSAASVMILTFFLGHKEDRFYLLSCFECTKLHSLFLCPRFWLLVNLTHFDWRVV